MKPYMYTVDYDMDASECHDFIEELCAHFSIPYYMLNEEDEDPCSVFVFGTTRENDKTVYDEDYEPVEEDDIAR